MQRHRVECIGVIRRDIVTLSRLLPIAYVIISVLIVAAVDGSCGQLGAGIVSEGIVHNLAVAGGIASGGTPEYVVCVFTLRNESSATMVSRYSDEISTCG